jgi:hypothetical protein
MTPQGYKVIIDPNGHISFEMVGCPPGEGCRLSVHDLLKKLAESGGLNFSITSESAKSVEMDGGGGLTSPTASTSA